MNRSQVIEKDHCKIILDAYNANPTSMMAALQNFKIWKEPQNTRFGRYV
ncbi:MAG: cyanophycin synthetase [Flavobacteriaceae bacterium]